MTVALESGALRQRCARMVTEVLAPTPVVAATTFVVAISSAGWGRGLLLGFLAALFAVGLPHAALLAGIRRGHLGDRHVRHREQRPAILGFALLSVVVGLALMWVLDAPLQLLALVSAMVAGLVVTLVISLAWKVSMHTACMAGAVVSLGVLVAPQWFILAPLAALTGWARVVLADHTLAQVVVGAVVGAGVAGLVLLAIL